MAAATRDGASATATLLEYGRGPGAQGVRGPQGRGILGMPPETSRPLTPGIAMALCGCPTPTLTLPTRSSCDARSRTSGGDEAETRCPGGETPRQLEGGLIHAPGGPGSCRAKSSAVASSRAHTREDVEGTHYGTETSEQRQPTAVGGDRRDAGGAARSQRGDRAGEGGALTGSAGTMGFMAIMASGAPVCFSGSDPTGDRIGGHTWIPMSTRR